MTVGIPGTGIGGIFYLASALLAPLEGLRRKRRGEPVNWRATWTAFAIALAVLAGIWMTGWILGRVLTAQVPMRTGRLAGGHGNIVRTVTLVAGLVTLALVLGTVQLARLLRWAKVLVLLLVVAPRLSAQAPQTARADSAYQAGDKKLAGALYRQVLDEHPDQSHAVFRMGQLAPSPAAALPFYRHYTELEPRDPWGFLALGDANRKLGRERSALAAYRAAETLAPTEPDVVTRIAAQRRRVSPALEPVFGYSRDSDVNEVRSIGVGGDVQAGDKVRFGGEVQRSTVSDPVNTAGRIDEAEALLRVPSGPLRIDATAGLSRLSGADLVEPKVTPTGGLRVRWRAPQDGPVVDVRVKRGALGASPLLINNEVIRSEARLGLDLPIGPLRLRTTGQIADVASALEPANRRLQGDGALVVPIGPARELNAQYHRLGYTRPSQSGYFAPELVETFEGGTYLEFGDRVVLALDLGAGAQRLREAGSGTGPWRLALRGYGYLAMPMGAGRQLRLEAEGYDAPFAPEGAVTSANWRYGSASLGIRWAL